MSIIFILVENSHNFAFFSHFQGPLQEENAEDIVMGQNDEMTMAQGTEAEGNKAQGSENDQEMVSYIQLLLTLWKISSC